MLPIAPLMIEHRIIERMINLIKLELDKIQSTSQIDSVFIDNAIDFIRIYADKTHHGKEEDILFRELKKKTLSKEHKKIMDELEEEHKVSRAATKLVEQSKNLYLSGDKSQLKILIEKLTFLTNFYPVHIEKEDKHFFIPIMQYFTPVEQNNLLEEGRAFDRKMIHIKYDKYVSEIEQKNNVVPPKRNPNWLDYF